MHYRYREKDYLLRKKYGAGKRLIWFKIEKKPIELTIRKTETVKLKSNKVISRNESNYKNHFLRVNPYAFAIAQELDAKTPPVYRFLSKKEYVEDFVQGKIRLSTLGHCRIMENEYARDEDEGKINPFISSKTVKNTNSVEDKAFLDDLRSLGGFDFEDCTNIRLDNVQFGPSFLPDAFVLCASNEINDHAIQTFGKYCVKIHYPHLFGYYVYLHLRSLDISYAFKCEKVSYGNQEVDFANKAIHSRVGFEKVQRFEPEDEFRFLFFTDTNNVEPQFIQVPEVNKICEIIQLV